MIVEQSELVEKYRTALVASRDAGFGRDEAKEIAKNTVLRLYPELSPDMSLWGAFGRVVQLEFPGEKTPAPAILESDNVPDDEEFFSQVLECATAGFVPHGKYLKSFLNGKTRRIGAHVKRLVENGWQCQEHQFGWITTPPLPPEKTPQEKYDELKKRLDGAIEKGDNVEIARVLPELLTLSAVIRQPA
jgi:hypothetical protein